MKQPYEPRYCLYCHREIPMSIAGDGSQILLQYKGRKYCGMKCSGLAHRSEWRYRNTYVGHYLNEAFAVEDVFRMFKYISITMDCWLWIGGTSGGRPSWSLHDYPLAPARVLKWLMCDQTEPDLFLCHTCDNGLCVNPTHTFWGTHQDNMDDCTNKGRRPKGESCLLSKLTELQVAEIRHARDEGCSLSKIADRYHITKENVYYICKRVTWKHIK